MQRYALFFMWQNFTVKNIRYISVKYCCINVYVICCSFLDALCNAFVLCFGTWFQTNICVWKDMNLSAKPIPLRMFLTAKVAAFRHSIPSTDSAS